MAKSLIAAFVLCAAFITELVQAQSSCPTPVSSSVPAPSVAPGFESRLVGTGLTTPRGIIFDSAGHLLVVERGVGIKALTLKDDGGTCVTVASSKMVIADRTLNHGIELINNGRTLLASSSVNLYAYAYNAATASNTTAAQTLVTGMDNADHSTRTLLESKFKPGTVVINRGSGANIDSLALDKSSGHAQVKAFDLSGFTVGQAFTPYDYSTKGLLLGWGVRNNVGIGEHPTTGGIFSVENSVDNIERDGTQFNQRNPGEKLQYYGTLINNTSPNQGSNFGYPTCFAAWAPGKVPNHGSLKIGQQFTINSTMLTDAQCRSERTAPRLVFNAHMAPLDIKFTKNGAYAFVTFHGSFNRPVPQGYKVGRVAFSNGMPTHASTSNSALENLVTNYNTTRCPTDCFRPVGLAFDGKGRLFFSSDATGEIYVIRATA